MKVFIVLAACVVAVSAGHIGHYGGAINTGTSTQFRQEDNYGNYNFGYDEAHATGATSRREESHGGVRRGSYSLSDADGRRRTVNYVADAYGFRANVHTNEPGVEPRDPADVLINKDGYAAVAAPAPVYAAPAPIGPVHAPVAVPAFAAPAPVYAAPAAIAPVAINRGYGAPAYGGPVAAGPVYAEPAYEAAPRAFSYSFGASHVAPVAGPAYAAPAPVVAGPIYQERLGY